MTGLDFNRPESVADVGADLAHASQSLIVRVRGLAITDRASLEQAVIDRQEIGERAKQVQAFFKPLKQMADKLHKAICDKENAILGPLLRQDAQHREAITAFKRQEDLARERRERELAEAQRRIDDERAAAEAADLEQAGETELAEAVLQQAMSAPAPVVVLPDVTKSVDGLKFRKRWLWRIKNEALIPREFLKTDDARISAYVRSMGAASRIDGVDVYFIEEPVR